MTGAGSASIIYTSPSGVLDGIAVADASNAYFSSAGLLPYGQQQKIYQESLSGGTPILLFATVPIARNPPHYSLVGSNGALLVMTGPANANQQSMSVLTLPVGGGPVGEHFVAGPFAVFNLSAAMCRSTFGDTSSAEVVLTMQNNAPGPGSIVTYSSEVLTPTAVVKQALMPNSFFLTPCDINSSGTVLQVRGITDTNGQLGGGTINAFDLSSGSAVVLATMSGRNYVVPSGDDLDLSFLSATVGLGTVSSVVSGVFSGLAFDVSKSLIVPVNVPNSEVVGVCDAVALRGASGEGAPGCGF